MRVVLCAGGRIATAVLVALPLSFIAVNPALSEGDLMRPAHDPAIMLAALSPSTHARAHRMARLSAQAGSDFSPQARGSLSKQTEAVSISCFPTRLRSVLSRISSHFGKPVIVTSGYRSSGRRGSLHRVCKAADIQIAGVSGFAIARYARSLDDVGGVGTYRHTRSVHVDIGERVFSWHGNRRRVASIGGGCCPDCARAGARGGRFEAVCTS